MSHLDYFSYKIVDYIVNVVLVEKKDHLRKRDIFNREFKTVFVIFLITYAMGLIFTAFISYFITNTTKTLNIMSFTKYVPTNPKTTYTIVQKNIMDRNIFNHEGEIPYEDTEEGSEGFIAKNFEKAACSSNEKLPVQVIGIIFTGNPETSLVTIKDPSVALADVYKTGQEIIDNEAYSVYKIKDNKNVEFRHDRIKICVTLNSEFDTSEGPHSITTPTTTTLNSAFVTQQLGPGFSKILNSARMVPEIVDGKTMGFKIFGIAKDSLFDKIQLMNDDVIKMVNGTNLQDSSQGFKIYEAFQDENNIILEIQRKGQTLTKRVSVQ